MIIQDLFNEYDGICFETTGSVTIGGKLLLDNNYSKLIIDNYPLVGNLLSNKLLKFKKNIPYVLGCINNNYEYNIIDNNILNNNLYKCILFSFPVKDKVNEPINNGLKHGSTIIIQDYINTLKLNNVCIITDGDYKSNNLFYLNK